MNREGAQGSLSSVGTETFLLRGTIIVTRVRGDWEVPEIKEPLPTALFIGACLRSYEILGRRFERMFGKEVRRGRSNQVSHLQLTWKERKYLACSLVQIFGVGKKIHEMGWSWVS